MLSSTSTRQPERTLEHVLVSAPTGSGKTLTAFLSAIDNLVIGRPRWANSKAYALWRGGRVVVDANPLGLAFAVVKLNPAALRYVPISQSLPDRIPPYRELHLRHTTHK
jgi:hypothetical protein